MYAQFCVPQTTPKFAPYPLKQRNKEWRRRQKKFSLSGFRRYCDKMKYNTSVTFMLRERFTFRNFEVVWRSCIMWRWRFDILTFRNLDTLTLWNHATNLMAGTLPPEYQPHICTPHCTGNTKFNNKTRLSNITRNILVYLGRSYTEISESSEINLRCFLNGGKDTVPSAT